MSGVSSSSGVRVIITPTNTQELGEWTHKKESVKTEKARIEVVANNCIDVCDVHIDVNSNLQLKTRSAVCQQFVVKFADVGSSLTTVMNFEVSARKIDLIAELEVCVYMK